jgi:hypothetical protein
LGDIWGFFSPKKSGRPEWPPPSHDQLVCVNYLVNMKEQYQEKWEKKK